ncbi:hypothetical protein WOLCODRAFT_166137 [Wolfiporia cocos MD-104 SS10]|uniref:Peptidase C14 caspase domain-containing protein n=1 Tax=Wolfiporia cocos (strain MD-104) TaxID=742152 RepID=A0A2H3JC33_WOLCO|nr:hypothetical protein WOLCODRAFT_166137 [Wolfiporia cocos MD-104 SS10]
MPTAAPLIALDESDNSLQTRESHHGLYYTLSDISESSDSSRASSPRPPRSARRKALSVAIRYDRLHKAAPQEGLLLDGTYADVDILKRLLQKGFHYKESDITVLKDDGIHMPPTRKNILAEMRRLVEDVQPDDHYVFHFSGHGSQLSDKSHDVIWPSDIFLGSEGISNYIRANEIHDILVEGFPSNAHLLLLFDCCHSGTAAELRYDVEDDAYELGELENVDQIPEGEVKSTQIQKHLHFKALSFKPNADEGESSPQEREIRRDHKFPIHHEHHDVISFAACADEQTTPDGKRGGIFMQTFEEVLSTHDYNIPIEEFLVAITDKIEHKIKKHNDHVARSEKHDGYKCSRCTPQLGCEESPDEVIHKTLEM